MSQNQDEMSSKINTYGTFSLNVLLNPLSLDFCPFWTLTGGQASVNPE